MGSNCGFWSRDHGTLPTSLHIPADLVEQRIQHTDTKYSTSSKWQAEHEGQVGAILPFLLQERGPQMAHKITGGHQSKDMYIGCVYVGYVYAYVCTCTCGIACMHFCVRVRYEHGYMVWMHVLECSVCMVCIHGCVSAYINRLWLVGLNIQLHLPRNTQSQSLGRVWALRRNWDPEPVRYVLYLESRVLHTLGLSISDPSTSHIFPVTEGSTHDKVAKIPFILSFFALQLTEEGKCVCVGVRSESETVGLECVGLTAHEEPRMSELRDVVVPRDSSIVTATTFPLWCAPCAGEPRW